MGSRLKPQSFRALFGPVSGPTGEVVLGSCALGAAWDAVKLPSYPTIEPALLLLEFPELNHRRPNACPECGFQANELSAAIIHLNDLEQWPRELIADWIDNHAGLFATTTGQIDCTDSSLDNSVEMPEQPRSDAKQGW
jgi:hypothetical protein